MRPSKSCMLLKRLGRSISKAREKRGFSQYQLADLARVNRSFLGEIEKGKVNITVKFLYKIAKVLKIKAAELAEDI